jgi:hypothetical protein
MSDQPPPPYGDQPPGASEPPVPPSGAPSGPEPTLPYGTPPAPGPAAPYQAYGQSQPYTTPLQPAYGYGYGTTHGGATTSMVLGIISIAVPVLGTCLCFLVGAVSVVLGPIGIWQALKARREIDAEPARYVNRGQSVAGLVCSIIGTVLGLLCLVGGALIVAIYGGLFYGAFSSDY